MSESRYQYEKGCMGYGLVSGANAETQKGTKMKVTADVIKDGLTHCNLAEKTKCDNCPYAIIELADGELCSERLAKDIMAFIDQLQKTNKELNALVLDIGSAVIRMPVKCGRFADALTFREIDTIRAFQKKAKEKFVSIDGTFECFEVEELIDEIASEMKNEYVKPDKDRYYLKFDAKSYFSSNYQGKWVTQSKDTSNPKEQEGDTIDAEG